MGPSELRTFDLPAFRQTPLLKQPFPYLVLPGFIKREARGPVTADYPNIEQHGSFPASSLHHGPAFAQLLADLNSDALRLAFEEKFGIDLSGRATMTTVRGRCSARDGRIHTDSENKIITVLLYLNPPWENAGGRLRLLDSAEDLERIVVEVPPDEGTLVAFRRSRNSYHGHKPYIGERRVIQFNWVTDERSAQRHLLRHHFSSMVKRIVPFA